MEITQIPQIELMQNTIDAVDQSRQFYLSRDGSGVEGPFFLEQLSQMWSRGEIYATAQLQEVGTETWQPVTNYRALFAANSTLNRKVNPALASSSGKSVDVVSYLLLAIFFGGLGIHNFTADQKFEGLIKVGFTAVAAIVSLFYSDFVVMAWLLAGVVLILNLINVIDALRGRLRDQSPASVARGSGSGGA